jgi:hypothetical protein
MNCNIYFLYRRWWLKKCLICILLFEKSKFWSHRWMFSCSKLQFSERMFKINLYSLGKVKIKQQRRQGVRPSTFYILSIETNKWLYFRIQYCFFKIIFLPSFTLVYSSKEPPAYRRLTLRWTSTWEPTTRLDTPTNSLDHSSELSSSMLQVYKTKFDKFAISS